MILTVVYFHRLKINHDLAWLCLAWLVWLYLLFFSMGLTSIKETFLAKDVTGFVQRDFKGFETRLK
jgi:hypothetical protein